MTLLRQPSATVIALGVGIFLGAGGTALLFKLIRNPFDSRLVLGRLDSLLDKVDELSFQVAEIKESRARSSSKSRQKVNSAHVSSGEEEFVDARNILEGNENDSHQRPQTEHDDSFSDHVGGKGNENSFFNKVDLLLEGRKSERKQAYNMLKQSAEKYKSNAEFHWRYSKATFQLAEQHKLADDAEKKKALLIVSKNEAEESVRLDPKLANGYKWYAIAFGSFTEFQGTQEKIESANKIRDHIEKGLQLNPKDAFLHYMLGRWCYRVYMMTWIERKLAESLFSSNLPTSTAEEALKHFMEAEQLRPSVWKENILHIAKCHIELKHYTEAVKWLHKAKKLKSSDIDDEETTMEINNLLGKYQTYYK